MDRSLQSRESYVAAESSVHASVTLGDQLRQQADALTFWKMKLRAPLLYSVLTQFTAQLTVSTTVTPGICCPVSNAFAPTSFVPIHNVKTVSFMLRRSDPFFVSVKNSGSWLSNTDGAGLAVRLFEHVAPERANGCRTKSPSCAANIGHAVAASPVETFIEIEDRQPVVSHHRTVGT